MTNLITPPPELVQQWANASPVGIDEESWGYKMFIAHHAAQWGADQQLKLDAEQIEKAYQAGADQELEACCEYLVRCAQWEPEDVTELRAARRPKQPSLKERALHELAAVYNRDEIDDSAYDAIRLALEALPND
jgi:hypothetical protein